MHIKNLGQLVDANIEFGDLTVFVGPQATGKSIALQTLKLLVDTGQIQHEMSDYGLDWEGQLPKFLDIYYGEGMRSLWHAEASEIRWNGAVVSLEQMARRKRKRRDEALFFIPAQRVLALRDGWPRRFTDYSPGDPFAVREFSEHLRTLVEQEFNANERLFPQERRLKREFRNLLQENLFSDFDLKIDRKSSQRRLVLGATDDSAPLPYMVWSAGQREFIPLLLGMYWLMPPAKVAQRASIQWVVLEELEMGLHPRAITVLLLMVLELVARGYRVCLSTHSQQILDGIWALRYLRDASQGSALLLEMFGSPKTGAMTKLADTVLKKKMKVYYFDRDSGKTLDISELDSESELMGESGWGGLGEFSGRANDVVARAVASLSLGGVAGMQNETV